MEAPTTTPTTIMAESNQQQQSLSSAPPPSSHILGRIQSYSAKAKRLPSDDEEKILVPLLARQAFHLPGNNWWQDWCQYMANNHPVFGICCHHPLHPIKTCTRIVNLIGTIVFGLATTNVFYLLFLFYDNLDQDFITFALINGQHYNLTTGMLLLWTVGGAIHTAYNLMIWHIAACACCRAGGCCESMGRCRSLGKHILRVLVMVLLCLAALIVLLRVAITNQEHMNSSFPTHNRSAPWTNIFNSTSAYHSANNHTNSNVTSNGTIYTQGPSAKEFGFLLGYLVETVLALLIYYPIGGTIVFSGILGCGVLPGVGGRPRDIAREQLAEAMQWQRSKELERERQQQQESRRWDAGRKLATVRASVVGNGTLHSTSTTGSSWSAPARNFSLHSTASTNTGSRSIGKTSSKHSSRSTPTFTSSNRTVEPGNDDICRHVVAVPSADSDDDVELVWTPRS